jgi:hypothetical protein
MIKLFNQIRADNWTRFSPNLLQVKHYFDSFIMEKELKEELKNLIRLDLYNTSTV